MNIYQILETLKAVEESNVEGIRINGKEVDMGTLVVADVRMNDYPDFSDAFISDGYYTDGTPISDDDLEMLTQERGDLVHELAHEAAIEQGTSYADQYSEGQQAITKDNTEQQAMELLHDAIGHGEWDQAIWIAHEFPGTQVDKLVTQVLLNKRSETDPNVLLHDLKELLNSAQMEEGWDPRNWGIWDKLNFDSNDTMPYDEKFQDAYPEKVARIAQGGGIGVQRTNNDVATASRMLVKYWTNVEKQPWSPAMGVKAKEQLKADVAKAMSGQRQPAVATAEAKDFPFANPKQRPGDQVRGKETAPKSKDHPFKGRLVGAAESVEEEKQRLDAKCWKGYKKSGTKMKGDTRVNNCVPVEEEWEQFVNEYGMTTGGTVTGDAQKDAAKQTAKLQQNVNKLKSAGVNIPSVSQATTSIAKDPEDPATQLDKNISQGLGQEVDQIITKGDDAAVNQLTQLIRKVKQSGAQ